MVGVFPGKVPEGQNGVQYIQKQTYIHDFTHTYIYIYECSVVPLTEHFISGGAKIDLMQNVGSCPSLTDKKGWDGKGE